MCGFLQATSPIHISRVVLICHSAHFADPQGLYCFILFLLVSDALQPSRWFFTSLLQRSIVLSHFPFFLYLEFWKCVASCKQLLLYIYIYIHYQLPPSFGRTFLLHFLELRQGCGVRHSSSAIHSQSFKLLCRVQQGESLRLPPEQSKIACLLFFWIQQFALTTSPANTFSYMSITYCQHTLVFCSFFIVTTGAIYICSKLDLASFLASNFSYISIINCHHLLVVICLCFATPLFSKLKCALSSGDV